MSLASDLEHYMLSLINDERLARGLAELKLEQHLNTSAEDHASWMLQTDTFSHTGREESSPTDRIRAADFDLSGTWSTAENIAIQSERGASGYRDDVLDLHLGLMASPQHLANILDPDLSYIGIGVELGNFTYSNGTTLTSVAVVQNFAATGGEVNLDSGQPADNNEEVRILKGSRASEMLASADGKDWLYGYSGNDSLLGGSGNDYLNGGTGADHLNGGSGVDQARYTLAKSYVLADLRDTYKNAGEANGDTYTSIENISGSKYDDSLRGNGWHNKLEGRAGDDWLHGRGGNDRLYGSSGDDRLYGDRGNDRLSGGSNSDYLNGGSGADRLYGGGGNDYLNGGTGADHLNGGSGVDQARYTLAKSYVLADLRDTYKNAGEANGDTYTSIENISGSKYDDSLRGNGWHNKLEGRAGDDWLHGRGGNDRLYGSSGNDRLYGNRGDDRLSGGSNSDYLNGGSGADRLYGGGGNDTLNGGSGNDRLYGGNGNDVLKGAAGSDTFILRAGDGEDRIIDFNDNVDTILLMDDLWTGSLTVSQVIDRYAKVVGNDILFDFGTEKLWVENHSSLSALQENVQIF